MGVRAASEIHGLRLSTTGARLGDASAWQSRSRERISFGECGADIESRALRRNFPAWGLLDRAKQCEPGWSKSLVLAKK